MGKWIYKTQQEIKEDQEKSFKSNTAPVIFAFLVFIFSCLFLFSEKKSVLHGASLRSFDEIILLIPVALLLSLLTFYAAKRYQLHVKMGLLDKDNIVICDRCGSVKEKDGEIRCRCLGKFVSIKRMKWIEDDHVEENSEEVYDLDDYPPDDFKTAVKLNFNTAKTCAFHPSKKSHSFCSVCRDPICYECFSKYRVVNDRKRIGFCSESCRTKYDEKEKFRRKENRIISIGMIPLAFLLFYFAYYYTGYPFSLYVYFAGLLAIGTFVYTMLTGKSYSS